MSTLFEDTRRHVESLVRDLEGDEDFLPIMAVRNHRDQLIVCGLMMPEEVDEKNQIANSMAALCTMHRAAEVAFTSTAWMVERKPGEEDPTLPPSQCADRKEIVFITTVDSDDHAEVHMANLVRENNMAGVGVWEQMSPQASGGGRFINAIKLGMSMGRKIPPDLGEYLDTVIEEGDGEKISKMLDMMTRTFGLAKEIAEKQMGGGVQN